MADNRTPDEIREDIEQTREEMGETVEALAEKADVKGQAQAKADETKQRIRGKAEEARAKLADASPEQAKAAAGNVAGTAQERPLPFAVGGAFLAGLIVGRLMGRRSC